MEKIGSSDNIIAEYDGRLTETVADKSNGSVEVTTSVPAGHKLETTITKDISKPSYIQVGNGNLDKEKRGTHSMDYTEELLNMSAPEGFMFKLLMKNRINPTLDFIDHPSHMVRKQYGVFFRSNETTIDNSLLTKTEKKYLSDGYKLLRKKDIVVRTKKQHYIINPRLVISNYDWKEDERLYLEAVEKLTKTR